MIVIGGENLIDFIEEPGSGGYPLYRAIPGGSPYNTAKAAARQGPPVGYLTPISDDTLGRLLRAGLTPDGVALLAPPSVRPTSLAVVSLRDGQPAYQFYREGTAERDVTLASLTASLPASPRAFYIGSLALAHGPDAEAWAALFEALAGRGVFTAIDPNIRAAFIADRAAYMTRLERLFTRANLIKLSDEDVAWLYPDLDEDAALAAIAARSGADLVVLTRGGAGAVALRGDDRFAVPPHPVANLRDTVGAGDTFMGSLLAQTAVRGLMAGRALAGAPRDTVAAILATAARAAAMNCARVGCNPPTSAELAAAELAEGA